MPPILTPQKLGAVVLESVEHGAYPDSEHVASAQLPPDALPTLLDGIERAQEEVKGEIRALSRDTAPDIDGWIAQAKQLQADIERSRATAHDIVQQAEAGHSLQAHVQDASSKFALLQNELAFNETLADTVGRIKDIAAVLDEAQDAAAQNHITEALDKMGQADEAMSHLGPFQDTAVAGILRKRSTQLRAELVDKAMGFWNTLLEVDVAEKRVTIKKETEAETPIDLDTVVGALSTLGSLDAAISKFYKALDVAIFAPRFAIHNVKDIAGMTIEGDTMKIARGAATPSILEAVEDMRHLITWFVSRLPTTVSKPLSEKVGPILIERLISEWLDPSIPVSLEGLEHFQKVLASVSSVADCVSEQGLAGHAELRDWVDKAPRNWLARRKEDALASVRTLCYRGTKTKKEVERVETQTISQGDALAETGSAGADEESWDAWDADEEQKSQKSETKPQEGEAQVEEEDMDASAWGIDDDEAEADTAAEAKSDKGAKSTGDEEDDTEAWGWGDDDDAAEAGSAGDTKSDTAAKQSLQKPNGEEQRPRTSEREMTLRERYTVTEVPDAIMEIIQQLVADAQKLTDSNFSDSPIAPAGFGLYSIPTLILAMYRATAATYYTHDIAGNMLIYNDATRLTDSLRSFLTTQAQKDVTSALPHASRPSTRLRLDADLKALESFSKRAYGKEMESQRTILRDLLDSAQGFTNCTIAPFAGECDNAVAMTVDRVREVAAQWRGVLSHSARLQSLGSLVATVTQKVIVDVEDMSDISEAESKQLRGFCERISQLSDLFRNEAGAGAGEEEPGTATGAAVAGAGDMTGVYTPNWFKFQYLSEILESSLADIKYLWTEGELKLEFEAAEVVDLIEALFAESEYRRKAIAEIKRGSVYR
ncbi:uncharacterized protein K452DRAFT_287375 [Aplosporella prunicola CBS 121167]|uniref:ZW10 C-terminal helical domain-containing protein n=1 Tax=Aplosporella prunicola CBS 121167 TaxID=1176127 RepID=A0A6A6BD99_9PEZI|nr:uncharacterized protein K452DRAFT_287375 [Aplosporella prunicola CBS 121167]KAF2142159.1 hypothetical protein K452DRAFT_287375 [Aplosporella prunicola CBS 121167]